MINIYSALIWTISIVLASFGAILFFMNQKRASKTLVFVSLGIAGWTASIGGYYYATTPELALFFVRIGQLAGSLIGIGLFLFGYVLHDEKSLPSKSAWAAIAALELVFIFLYFQTDFFAKEVVIRSADVLDRTIMDPSLAIIHHLYVGALAFAGLKQILHKQRKAETDHDREHSGNIITLIVGCAGFLALVLLFTRILGYNRYYWLVSLTGILWLASMSYSLTRFGVVPLRSFIAQVTALSMSAIAFADIFIGDGVVGTVGRTAVFLFFALVSFFFIRLLSSYEHQKEHLVNASTSLKKLNGELDTANKRLQELDLQRSKFVSIASHQLRAPLTAIVGYSSMLLEGSFGKIPKKASGAAEKILQSGKTLIGTITDFLDISTLEMGQLHFAFAEVDISPLCIEVFETMKHNAEAKGLELRAEIPNHALMVYADKDKLRHVLVNLVDNAIHYTPSGSISLTLSKTKTAAVFAVEDTGIGMSPETVSKLFGKFARGAEARAHSAEGVGLGMYLAQEIVKAHKGSIKAHSPGAGKGSKFTVEIPLKK